MGQPHKGSRRLTQTRIPESTYAKVKHQADELGVSVSQYVADLVCFSMNDTQLMRELSAEHFPYTPIQQQLEVFFAEPA